MAAPGIWLASSGSGTPAAPWRARPRQPLRGRGDLVACAMNHKGAMDREQMGEVLRRLVAALYGGTAVPPAEGGRFFRDICDERRRVGDLFWTEHRLHDLARELGFWPWSVAQIGAAIGA